MKKCNRKIIAMMYLHKFYYCTVEEVNKAFPSSTVLYCTVRKYDEFLSFVRRPMSARAASDSSACVICDKLPSADAEPDQDLSKEDYYCHPRHCHTGSE